jgi:hypothetical protein
MARWTPSTAAAFVALASLATVATESELGWKQDRAPAAVPLDAGVTPRPRTVSDPPPASVDEYFPPGRFEQSRALISEWYGRPLLQMSEPSLWKAAGEGKTALRFLLVPSFRSPTFVRLERDETGARLVAVRDGDVRVERPLSLAEWDHIDALLAEASFDTMPLDDRDEAGLDGEQWIVERARSGTYRLVSRWSPRVTKSNPGYRRACEAMLALAGPDVTER